ncbi:MAG: DUF3105 domain-containing protein [Sandaracinaceae bacterium]|jgi:hypothetical protein|nr:DUF3105 domain-containing protein [Sandaracinaceae bacterium]
MTTHRHLHIALLFVLIGCARSEDVQDAGGPLSIDGGIFHADAMALTPATECTVSLVDAPGQSGAHVDPCTQLAYPTMPPMGGTHYSAWASFEAYDAPVPHGFLVHSMEHGAVILYHQCLASECPELVAAMRAIPDAVEADPACSATLSRNRIIVVPDPTLDVPVAVSAWGHSYRATCFDEASIRAFITAHYAMATENFCAPGQNRTADGGTWCAEPTL